MFRHVYQSGLLSVLYSIGSNPLQIWEKQVKDGHIKRTFDEEIESPVLEIVSTELRQTYIACPPSNQLQLGIKLPFLIFIVKCIEGRYFTLEVEILDSNGITRRFRASNYQFKARVSEQITTMGLRMEKGWNQVALDLNDLCRRAYGTNYAECSRVQVHACCRIRRIYFSERIFAEDELPNEFKLYLPIQEASATADTTADATVHGPHLPTTHATQAFEAAQNSSQVPAGRQLEVKRVPPNPPEPAAKPYARKGSAKLQINFMRPE